jgi:two-component system response regulator
VSNLGEWILMAEDNPSDAELVLEALASSTAGFDIVVARDGVEALDALFLRGTHAGRAQRPPPRLVLLDVKLPRVDGMSVLRELRQDERTRTIPVVMLTSSNLTRDVAEAYSLGANSYVQKPVEFRQFRDTVRRIGEYWLTVNERAPGARVERGRS